MKIRVHLLIFLLLLTFSALPALAAPLEKVTLQLKWLHQFQFAGYYAAKEQGYYADAGLDVQIFAREPNKDVVEQVVSGEMDYGVGDSGILSYYARGEPIVALAAIFQHNPLVFVSKKSSGIISPYEMRGKRIMFDVVGADDSVLRAVLAEARLTEENYTAIKQSFRNDDLLDNKVDVMSAYLSDEVFYFQQKNVKINIINPQNYGIDFYGDMLFTSQRELLQHSGRAEKFRLATLKGWQYALNHPEELIRLIRTKYHRKLSLAHLRFEAEMTRKLILPDVIPLGQIEAGRLRKVAEVYAQLGISKPLSDKQLNRFINPLSHADDKPLIVGSEQDFPPFALGKTDATADGFTVELWRAVATESHLDSVIHVRPFHDILQGFKKGDVDVLINLAQSEERREFADFTIPHVIVNGAFFVRDNDDSIHSEADLINKRLIVLNADLAQDYALSKGWEKQLVLVNTAEQGMQLLSSGQHDAMLISKLTGKQTLAKLRLRNIKMLGLKVGFSQKFSFAVRKGDAELLAKINEGLALTKANGTYDRLYEKWFGVYEDQAVLPRLLKLLVPIVLVFLIILSIVFYRRRIERQLAQQKIQQSERHLRLILDAATDCVKLIARDGTLLSINPSGLAILEAQSEAAVCHRCIYPLITDKYRAVYQAFNESICDGKSGTMEFEIIGLKGKRNWMETHSVPFKLEDGQQVHLAFSQEITERKIAEETIKQLAFYDPLTGLANRRLLQERLKHSIDVERRMGKRLALLMLDLDKFKAVNDTFGHLAGDELLQQVAQRISSRLRDVDMVVRLGGDEFIILLEDISHIDDVSRVAKTLLDLLSQSFMLNQNNGVEIGASIGISLYPEHGNTPEQLLDHADAALYQAKDAGRGCFAYFSNDLTEKARARINLEARLRKAIDQQELQVYFQAQVDVNSGLLVGAEALVRWHDPQHGLMMPSAFIALAEETGLIIPLGAWVLRETCRLGQHWLNQGLPPIILAVNVSPYQFRRCDISALVTQVLNETGFPAHLLELEITESGLMENQENALVALNALHNLGVHLAIDDFGTGYSSLANLKFLPLDVLKIDKSFIDDIPYLQSDMAITASIIAMAHHLGFSVLAEGVETAEQLAFLKAQGCDLYQGYLYSKPLTAKDFGQLLEACAHEKPAASAVV